MQLRGWHIWEEGQGDTWIKLPRLWTGYISSSLGLTFQEVSAAPIQGTLVQQANNSSPILHSWEAEGRKVVLSCNLGSELMILKQDPKP